MDYLTVLYCWLEALSHWDCCLCIQAPVFVPVDKLLSFSNLLNWPLVTQPVRNFQVAKESADVIILDDNFSTIVTVAKWGRSVYINIQKFVQFQLTVNVVALVVNFSSACLTGKKIQIFSPFHIIFNVFGINLFLYQYSFIPLFSLGHICVLSGNSPLTAVQLLWVNMIMDTLGALALATEPPNDELMKRLPVGRKGNFISNVMWRNILGQSVYQFAIIWFLQTRGKAFFNLGGTNSDLILNTIIFNSFVFCQVILNPSQYFTVISNVFPWCIGSIGPSLMV